jgi:putative tricarboxylic transport membrane protein
MREGIRRADFWSGLALAALGAYIIGAARQWEYLGPDGPGAGFFPLWYGVAMVVLSTLLVARSTQGVITDSPSGPQGLAGVRRALACWCALVVSVALLKIVGFIGSFALLTWFIVAVLFRQPQRRAWAIAVGGALAFYVLFRALLGVTLPAGLWHLL